MPTPLRGAAKGGLSVAKTGAVSYVKFSDKLTGSINDFVRIIEQPKEMIDSIQEIALELTASIGSLHTLTVKYAHRQRHPGCPAAHSQEPASHP